MGGAAFLVPLGLLALLAPVVIVILHMRRRRPPPLSLPSLRFWEPVRIDAADQRRFRRPPMSLPLVLQVIAAMLVALALARPIVPNLPGAGSSHTNPQHTIVVLDGSTSMLAVANESGNRTRWDVARRDVLAIIDRWQKGDVVTVITMGSSLQTRSASTEAQRGDLREAIATIQPPGGIADLDRALRMARDILLPDRDNRVLVVSDGALSANPELVATIDAPISLQAVGLGNETPANTAITSIGVRPVSGNSEAYRLSFSVTSYSDVALRLPYRVRADARDITSDDLALAPGETRTVSLTLPTIVRIADVILDVRDGFAGDNRAAVLVNGTGGQGLRVLLISDTPTPLERAIGALPEARVDVFPTTTPGIRALAEGYDLAVFEGVAPASGDVPSIPMIFVRPSAIGERFVATGVMPAPVITSMSSGSPVLDGVDLAGVTFGDTPAYTLVEGETELVRGGVNGIEGPLIWEGSLESSPYIAIGFDLATSNITQRVAFPVLMARAVGAITTPPLPGALAPGESARYVTNPDTSTVTVTAPGGFQTRIEVPESAGSVVINAGSVPGLTSVHELDAQDQQIGESAFMVNAGSLVESDLRPNPALADLLATSGDGSGGSAIEESAVDLWPLLAGVALAVVALEWLAWSVGGRRFPSLWRQPRTGGAS